VKYKNNSILYIDDDPQNLSVFEFAFLKRYKIFITETIPQAWEILDREEIGVIISDQRMPEQLGIDLLKEVSQKYPEIIRILLTAYADINLVFEAINTGKVYAYITKPWDGEDLKIKLDNALEAFNLKRENKDLIYHLSKSNEELNLMNTKLHKEIAENSILTHAIEQTSELVILMDTAQHIVYVNGAFIKVSGYSKQEVVGKKISDLDNNVQKYLPQHIWDDLKKGIAWTGKFDYKKKNGETFKHETTISTIFNSNNQITNYVLVGRDVTKEAEMQEMLNQKQKLEAIGILAGGIAHDFNNILVPIQGYALLLEDEINPESQAWDDLQQIINATERAKHLVEQILTFSQKRTIVLKKIHVIELIKDALKLIKSSIPQNVQTSIEINATNDYIFADPVQIQQIIINLCNNAFQAMENNQGILKITIQNTTIEDNEKYIFSDLTLGGEYLEITVGDNGMGMSKEVVSKIFDPFFTTKQKGKGTGLGLSNVHGIVSSLKGNICVETEIDKGTTFHILLPTIKNMEQTAISNQKIQKGNKQLLIVIDDDELVLNYLTNTLKDLNYKAKAFVSCKEAFEFIKEYTTEISLIISDFNMPEMTGKELIDKLKENNISIEVILITGFKQQLNKYNLSNIILSKPFSTIELSQAIQKVLITQLE